MALSRIAHTALSSGAAIANVGYTPVNKAGDTMSDTLTIGAEIVGTVYADLMKMWRSADMQGYKNDYSDGGSVTYTWDNGLARMDYSGGGHSWDIGKIRLPAGTYRVFLQYRPSPTSAGWTIFGNNSNAIAVRLITDAGYGSYSVLTGVNAQLNKDLGYSQRFVSDPYTASEGTYRINLTSDPYNAAGYKCFVEAAYLVKVK